MKEAIKKYFEEQIKVDAALAEVYQETKLEGCVSYIQKQARKQISGTAGFIADEVVYKWARDFMLGDIEEEKKPAKKNDKTTTAETESVMDSDPVEITDDMEEQPEMAAETVEPGTGSDEPIDVSEVMDAEKDFIEVSSGELHRNHVDCGCYSDGKCLNKGSKAVIPNEPACSDFCRKATDTDIQKLKIEKVESLKQTVTKKEEKKNVDDDNNFLFDFMYD